MRRTLAHLVADGTRLRTWCVSLEERFVKRIIRRRSNVGCCVTSRCAARRHLAGTSMFARRAATAVLPTTRVEIDSVQNVNINAPSSNTPRIQECHMLAYHIICEIIDEEFTK